MVERKHRCRNHNHVQYLLLFLFFVAQATHAQIPDPFFKKIGIENGLPHHKVNCLLQDRRGFLWFGTEDGLSRYDGRHFAVYRHIPNDSTTISGNTITDLHEDSDSVLWIATRDGGMSRYDYRLSPDRQFKQFRYDPKNAKGIPENSINAIAEDKVGCLWLGTTGSYVVRFNKKTGEFSTPVKTGTKIIYSLAMGGGDTLWVGGAGRGLLRIDTRNLSSQSDKRYNDLYAKLPHASITRLFRDDGNNMWMGTWDKRVYTISQQGAEKTVDPNAGNKNGAPDDVVAFAEDAQHNVWMAGKTSGLIVLHPASGKARHYHHELQQDGSLSDDHVNDVYIDRNNIVWVATDNGVSMYDPLFSPFKEQDLPSRQSGILVYDFYKDSSGNLWMGTSDGIFIKRKNAAEPEHRPVTYRGVPLSVTKFFSDVDGSFYVGTNYTLFRYDKVRNRVTPLPNTDKDPVMKKLIESRIVSIVRDTIDNHPVLIVSPYGHCLAYYDLADKIWVSRLDSTRNILRKYNIKDNLIRKLFKDKSNNIWLATQSKGLGEWQPGYRPIQYFTNDTRNESSLTSNDVFDILQTSRGDLWISTYGGGVNLLETSKNRFVHMVESSNLTEGMQLDEQENLWMICNGHFHKYSKSDGIYSCYDLPRLHNNSGLSGYVYKDAEGTLYAAGTNFYLSFHPSEIKHIDNSPSVYFTDFKIYDRSFSQYLRQGQIELNYSDKMFSIEFAAPEYTGDNLRYAYMMEGADPNWIHAGKNNVAQYSNLTGGTYHFRVKATNWDGTYGNQFSELIVVIKNPFWESAPFIIGGLLVLSGLGYFVYRYRVNVLLKQQAIRNVIAQDLHDQIGSTLSSISLYSEVAKRYAKQKDEQALEDVLDTIHLTANDMTADIGDIVWAINPQNDQLDSLIMRINKYAKPLCDAKGIQFNLEYDPGFAKVPIGSNSRKNLFFILKESINNAIKHSGCRNLSVRITLHENIAGLMIKDDGKGFAVALTEDSTYKSAEGSNGLNNIQSRAAELGAALQINSERNKGTTIKIKFKVNGSL